MKKVFFCSSDPGGANVIAAVARRMPEGAPYRLFTDASGYRVDALRDRYEVLGDGDVLPEIFQIDPPDVVFTATSLSSLVECRLRAGARHSGIPCAAVIDHWNDFVLRFEDGSTPIRFPDVVLVADETAVRMAQEEGIPAEKLQVFGNPHFFDAQFYHPPSRRDVFWRDLGVRSDRPILVFLSDSLTETAGGRIEAERRFGYTESNIIESIAAAISSIDLSIVIRPHPKEVPGKYTSLRADPRISVVADAPLWEMLSHSDHVIGMFSSALIEAVVLGKSVLRVEIGAGSRDLLPVPQDLFFDRIVDSERLAPGLTNYLSAPRRSREMSFLSDAFNDVVREWLL